MNAGIVVRRDPSYVPSPDQRARLEGLVLEVRCADSWQPPWRRTLFAESGDVIPWDLLRFGYDLLERWEVAAPLDPAGRLANALGTPDDRERTQSVLLDLRVPVYSPKLVLVNGSDDALRFLAAWRIEAEGGDEQLAMLRALARVKPLFCALPGSWLAPESTRLSRDAAAGLAPRRRRVVDARGRVVRAR